MGLGDDSSGLLALASALTMRERGVPDPFVPYALLSTRTVAIASASTPSSSRSPRSSGRFLETGAWPCSAAHERPRDVPSGDRSHLTVSEIFLELGCLAERRVGTCAADDRLGPEWPYAGSHTT
jgi:hypothetical protein